ncbi:MAG: class I SAM-dependent methyltransferase [Rickettsiales bacterium]|nr:class I SAM-dependent methyltransferase [Rickettsiales bacterium]
MAHDFKLNIDDDLYKYALDVSLREDQILRELREETQKLENKIMQIPPEQGQFMALLIRLINAHKVLEIGTFTGYSTLALAMALPDNGNIITCDLNEEWTDIAKRYWERAGVSNKINLYLAPAIDSLTLIKTRTSNNKFDFIFIDADKKNYDLYYEITLDLLRPGGILLIDNTLWYGKVIDLTNNEEETISIRNLNSKLKNDNRIHLSLLSIYDGLTIIYKK